MLVSHAGHSPRIDPTAWVAPNACICGDVVIGPGCRILYGAQVIAEGGSIELGRDCIVMENAVLRSTARHSLMMGDHCLVGPNTHVVGCTVEDQVFIATGASVFHAAHLARGCEVRIGAVVHLRSRLAPGENVPIGWVAVGDPARLLPPDQHEQIWALQQPLDFPLTVYGLQRADADMVKITRGLSEALASHGSAREIQGDIA
ncbi:gamma carbonic anhydrase family protein [Aquabacterium sp. A7-Y]|uniref:gamma carbonic anhydrase family protein n=1 Tax=Aquabacterium sp. A7-Y TaxID=1349605 RepID=UPI00223DB939|nr:gamma carbonic anhydrase family protein [Aquabacterium sp. A7-Y]MCW7538670.1 gamma carbonic anhydrase family protein [Aquabacterium sp. A7-Y]